MSIFISICLSGFSYSEAFYFAFAGFEKAGKRQFADERGIEEAHRLVEGDLAVEAVASCRVDLDGWAECHILRTEFSGRTPQVSPNETRIRVPSTRRTSPSPRRG